MRKPWVWILLLGLLAIASVVGLQLRGMATLWAKVPSSIREAILSNYDSIGRDGVVLRAYSTQGSDTFAVMEFKPVPSCPWTNVDVYRITESGVTPRLEKWRLMWFGGVFEAAGHYAEVGPEITPRRQYAVGVALDKRIARIVTTTEDGRSTSTEPFDGYWWMTAPMDPANYSRDRWVKAAALDSKGRVLYECTPEYPKLGR